MYCIHLHIVRSLKMCHVDAYFFERYDMKCKTLLRILRNTIG